MSPTAWKARLGCALILAVALALAASGAADPKVADPKAAGSRAAAGLPLDWAPAYANQNIALPPEHAAIYRLCGAADAGLAEVAGQLAAARLEGEPPPSQDALKTLVRAAGLAQPWPRAWSLAGQHDANEVQRRLDGWLKRSPSQGQRRCGVARWSQAGSGVGRTVLAVVTVDLLATLKPFATRTTGYAWQTLDARLPPDASDAEVVLLGPRRSPRRILAGLHRGRLRSRFRLDQPGRWLIQVVATLPSGPRPLLEFEAYVDSEPPLTLVDEPPQSGFFGSPRQLLRQRLQDARATAGAPALRSDPRLQKLALRHAEAMRDKQRVAHDLGDGSPPQRVARAGYSFAHVGENVASSRSAAGLHKALWDSPSHRENLLSNDYRRVGIAAVTDSAGRIWAVQLFAR